MSGVDIAPEYRTVSPSLIFRTEGAGQDRPAQDRGATAALGSGFVPFECTLKACGTTPRAARFQRANQNAIR
jgi:hypothetical protein